MERALDIESEGKGSRHSEVSDLHLWYEASLSHNLSPVDGNHTSSTSSTGRWKANTHQSIRHSAYQYRWGSDKGSQTSGLLCPNIPAGPGPCLPHREPLSLPKQVPGPSTRDSKKAGFLAARLQEWPPKTLSADPRQRIPSSPSEICRLEVLLFYGYLFIVFFAFCSWDWFGQKEGSAITVLNKQHWAWYF